ncbi:MAG: protein kinase [Coriobacteriia bacterium]|nr:protein kinase [Coriobacteriia bacterium]
MAARYYHTKGGKTYTLGGLISKEAKGGEGSVHRLPNNPDLVAKIYRVDLGSDDLARRGRKIEAMLAKGSTLAADQTFAWPLDSLYDVNGVFVGYVMRSAADKIKLSKQLSDKLRKNMTLEELIVAASNLARTIDSAHSQSYVIGDLKPENLLVSSAVITVIDVDSFQFSVGSELFPCRAGTPEWLPPELQNASFTNQSFSLETDCWALAVIIFKLLMNDTHPFTHRVTAVSAERTTQKENIINGISAHFPDTHRSRLSIARPLTSPPIESLPLSVRKLFEQAFIEGHLAHWSRPKAADWIEPLRDFREQLVKCRANSSHQYWQGAAACPWCEIEKPAVVGGSLGSGKTCTYCGTSSKANAVFCSRVNCGRPFPLEPSGPSVLKDSKDSDARKPLPAKVCPHCYMSNTKQAIRCRSCNRDMNSSASNQPKSVGESALIAVSVGLGIFVIGVLLLLFFVALFG